MARDDARSSNELRQGVVVMATAMPTIEGAIGDAIREQLAAVGVTDIRRGHGKRFWEAVCVEATLDDASYLVSIEAQIAKMKLDGFERVEGWYAFLDRELSAFGLEQTGGPIAGALREPFRDTMMDARMRQPELKSLGQLALLEPSWFAQPEFRFRRTR